VHSKLQNYYGSEAKDATLF